MTFCELRNDLNISFEEMHIKYLRKTRKKRIPDVHWNFIKALKKSLTPKKCLDMDGYFTY